METNLEALLNDIIYVIIPLLTNSNHYYTV